VQFISITEEYHFLPDLINSPRKQPEWHKYKVTYLNILWFKISIWKTRKLC